MAVTIGMTATPAVYDDRPVDEVTRAHTTSVLRAGGTPLIVPVLPPDHAATLIAGLDGLLLTGGGDVDPRHYGGRPHDAIGGVDPARDEWELALYAAALDAGVPVLGLCRGAQVINVAAGGTLVAHLPERTEAPHRVPDRVDRAVHPVEILPGSRLAWAMGRDRADVNSLHHQAVDSLGRGLRPVAWSPDGVIEGIESITHTRVLGVQWHPELLPHVPGNPELFAWLVDEARVAGDTRRAGEAAGAALVTVPAATADVDLVDAVA